MPVSPAAAVTATRIPTRDDVAALYHTPVLELVFHAAEVHLGRDHDPSQVQACVLLSVRRGGGAPKIVATARNRPTTRRRSRPSHS